MGPGAGRALRFLVGHPVNARSRKHAKCNGLDWGDVARITQGDVQVAIGAEFQTTAIVAATGPLNDDTLRIGITAGRIVADKLETGDPCSLGAAFLGKDVSSLDTRSQVRDIKVSISLEIRMQCKAKDRAVNVKTEVGCADILPVGEGVDFPKSFRDKHAPRLLMIDQYQRFIESEVRKCSYSLVGRWRIGCSLNS